MAQSFVMCFGAIFVTLLLVSMHACNAREIPGFGIYRKDIADEKTNLQRQVNIKGWGRQERMIQESKTHENKEPAGAIKDDEPVEDAVVMDYVTPHRKSPIHN
ncbi:hypothetical protein RND81_08G129400 [Saponaria officinalis]|uniref:Uncharacterized protein n=1 Tax=Saponaria officinalis TaxID=3572 RepID=A0AAW1J5W3_SAPOF